MDDSLFRILIWFVFTHTIHLTRVSPAIATNPYKKGNKHVDYRNTMINLNIFGVCQLYHLIVYFGQPISYFELILLVIFLLGTILRFWSYYALGKYFTFQIQVQENQKIIKTGPYKYFAHPGYVGQFILTITSFAFYAVPLYLNIVITGYACYLFYYRIKNEEKMLKDHFGNDYVKYRRSVW